VFSKLSVETLLQKWSTEYKKGFSKPLILFTLAQVEQSYPYRLTKKVLELTKGQISIAGSNIYPILSQLEEDNLISSKIDDNNRKFYTLSDKGRDFLRQLGLSFQEFHETMLNIVNNSFNKGDSK
jgi:DNA-binding PadR family transcriptional regulator